MRHRIVSGVATGGAVNMGHLIRSPAPPPPPRRFTRIDVDEGCWVEVDEPIGRLPTIVTVCFPGFGCGAWWDGTRLTRSALGFTESGRKTIPLVEAALRAWGAA